MDIRNRHFDPMTAEEWIQVISETDFTSEELGWIYCCAMWWYDLLKDPENLPAVTKAMLDRGMNPSQLVAKEIKEKETEEYYYETPLIIATRFYWADFTAAESLKLLLESGGDPNTVYYSEGPGEYEENVFGFYSEDEWVHAPDLNCGTFYGLLLCAAYGGKNCNGYNPFAMLIDAPISIFKDYDRYWYEYDEDHSSTMYVIEKETDRRVARYH